MNCGFPASCCSHPQHLYLSTLPSWRSFRVFFIWSDYKHLQAVSLTLNNPIAQSKKGRIQWRSSLKTVSSLKQLDSWEAKPWNVQHRGKILLELQILFCRIRSTVMICIFFSPLTARSVCVLYFSLIYFPHCKSLKLIIALEWNKKSSKQDR